MEEIEALREFLLRRLRSISIFVAIGGSSITILQKFCELLGPERRVLLIDEQCDPKLEAPTSWKVIQISQMTIEDFRLLNLQNGCLIRIDPDFSIARAVALIGDSLTSGDPLVIAHGRFLSIFPELQKFGLIGVMRWTDPERHCFTTRKLLEN